MSKLTKYILFAVAFVAVALVSFGVGSWLANRNPSFQGITDIVNGVLLAKEGVISGDVKSFSELLKLEQGEVSKTFTNRTGKDLFVNNVVSSVIASSTAPGSLAFASSTYKVYVVASSTAEVIGDYTAPVGTATSTILINGFLIATSTHATSTSMFDTLVGPVNHELRIPDGGTVQVVLQTNCIPTSPSQGLGCLSATNTQRGFNLDTKLFFHD